MLAGVIFSRASGRGEGGWLDSECGMTQVFAAVTGCRSFVTRDDPYTGYRKDLYFAYTILPCPLQTSADFLPAQEKELNGCMMGCPMRLDFETKSDSP